MRISGISRFFVFYIKCFTHFARIVYFLILSTRIFVGFCLCVSEMESRASGTFSLFGIIPSSHIIRVQRLVPPAWNVLSFKCCYRMLSFKFIVQTYNECGTNICDLHSVVAQRGMTYLSVWWWTRGNGIPFSCRCSHAIDEKWIRWNKDYF